MLSNRPGEIFEPVTATRIGWNAWREFQRALDPLAPPKPLPPGRY